MLQRIVSSAVGACATLVICAHPASAQQTVNFTLGYFAPLGEDARVPGDVINANRTFLVFEVDEFGGPSIGGEWLVGLGQFVEAGAGVSFSRRTVPSVYQSFVDSDGTEIDQDLRLRLVPLAFTVRVLPFGQSSPVQPYVGAGLGIINWRYSETGEFVDFGAGNQIFRDSFVATGSETGPIVLGGIRFAGDSASAGGEIRYQKADAPLSSDFAGRSIDLGGWTYNFTVGFRF
jgi:hypothetical protein